MVAVYGMTETTTAVTIHDPAKCEDRFLRIDKKKYFSENILIECNSAEKKEYFDIAYVGKPVHGVSIKICDENGFVVSTPLRENVYSVQTPQTFKREIIEKSFEKAFESGVFGTDDATLAENAGYRVFITEGSYENIKISHKRG